jgi:hypothetical protein
MIMFPVYVIDIMLNGHPDGVTLWFSGKCGDFTGTDIINISATKS